MQRSAPIPDSYELPLEAVVRKRPFPGRLFAGEYPAAKSLPAATEKLTHFVNSGITCFVDLTEAGEYNLRPYADLVAELAQARGLSVAHHRQSIPDMGTPTPAKMIAILDAIDAALEQGERVYVHCFGGIGRTGTVIGCWLVRHGLTGADALAQIATLRQPTPDGWKQSPETTVQRQMVLSWRE